MQLKKYTDYGLRVLIYLAASEQDKRATISDLSEVFSVPKNHLNKVVHHLGKLGLIKTWRGKGGGFSLATDANRMRLDSVIRQLEGDEEWIDCLNPRCKIYPVCDLKGIIHAGKEQFYSYLAKYTIASLVERPEEIQVHWHINT
ncbi:MULTISPECIES: Rrf2 family transcriptional regulator [unclassified Idiomarina]|uniref:Rrf2 family transcriptional regulator n=1 Tax=unclassified Idiomarina TaxID=2614829 RepID=UPI000C8FA6C1|nr:MULTISPECIES: Rrf2 family transcriptional regulator [unclassified Idiomarina]MAD53311.1 transcriptional regulator [Idiomarinaceae bacterium]MEC7643737.1 Rrf2 family transcriptional regulator [Pseudomonadota bacterium]NQZ04768.1 Rrf2 family transcriptional regulator [Idiomarina sp.]